MSVVTGVFGLFRAKPKHPVADGGRMALADHLRELRARIMRVALVLTIATVVAWFFYPQLFDMIRYTHAVSPAGVLSAYRDNAAVIAGSSGERYFPDPGSGIYRNLKTLHVFSGAIGNVDVTVQHTDGTTISQLHKVTLVPGATLQYVDEVGFLRGVGTGHEKHSVERGEKQLDCGGVERRGARQLGQGVLGLDCQSRGQITELHIQVHRLVSEPARLREFLRKLGLQPPAGGGAIRLEQKAKTLAAVALRFLPQAGQKIERLFRRRILAVISEPRRAVGVVEIEN